MKLEIATTVALQNFGDCYARLPDLVADEWRDASDLWREGVLTLQICVAEGTEARGPIYLGSRGAASTGTLSESLSLDYDFARNLALKDGDTVIVSVFERVERCLSIGVTPLSENDWEIVDLNARWLEDNLMACIRVVYPSMVFFCELGNGSRVFCKVDSLSCERGDAPCALLSLNSEVYVKPRERRKLPTDKELSQIWLRVGCSDEFTAVKVNSRTFKGIASSISLLLTPSNSISAHGKKMLEKSIYELYDERLRARKLCVETCDGVPEGVILIPRTELGKLGIPCNVTVLVAGYSTVASTGDLTASDSFPLETQSSATGSLGPAIVETPQLVDLFDQISQGLQASCSAESLGVNLLVTGGRWSGKSTISAYAALRLSSMGPYYTWHLDGAQLLTLPLNKFIAQLEATTDWLTHQSPSVLIIDNLCYWFPAIVPEERGVSSYQAKLAAHLFVQHLLNLQSRYSVSVIATGDSLQKLSTAFQETTFFSNVIKVPAPNRESRRALFSSYLERAPSEDMLEKSSKTWTLQDIVLFSSRVKILNESDLALEDYVPLLLRSRRDHCKARSPLRWSAIGGLEDAKEAIKETLLYPVQYSKLYSQCRIRLPCNMLLYGYPGTGKSMLASSIPHECNIEMLVVKGPELLGKYVGQSEEAVRKVFSDAQLAKPCVLLFEEFESIAPRRGGDNSGVTDRVVNQLLTQLDGVESCEGVYVVATSNRPDLIDPALLRPGRLDVHVFCDIPTPQDRVALFKIFAESYRVTLSPDELLNLAEATAGFTPADLTAVFTDALLSLPAAVNKDQSSNLSAQLQGGAFTIFHENDEWKLASQILTGPKCKQSRSKLSFEQLKNVIKTARPSIRPDQMRRLKSIYDSFSQKRGITQPPVVDAKVLLA